MTDEARSMPKHPRCAGQRRDGQPCTAPVFDGGRYCFAHDPARAAARQAARVKGGQGKASTARAAKLLPAVLRPVLDTLLATLTEAKAGTLDPRQATAVATVARALVAVYQAGTLEERVQALEAAQAPAPPEAPRRVG